MYITILKDGDYYWLTCKNPIFREAWGDGVKTTANMLYTNMRELATWVNNQLGQACLFEIAD